MSITDRIRKLLNGRTRRSSARSGYFNSDNHRLVDGRYKAHNHRTAVGISHASQFTN